MDFQAEKKLVTSAYAAIGKATASSIESVLRDYVSDDWSWRGMHPFHEQSGATAVAETFWIPFLSAMTHVQRRQDIFFAGRNQIDGFQSVWTVSMGHLMALFDQPFLGIPPTNKIVMLRYAEFNRVENGQIQETAFFCDLLHLMHQAGLRPLPPQTGAHLVQPGPATHDGLQFGSVPETEGAATLALINRMIGDIAANSNTPELAAPRDATPQEELARCWHDDMIWWGPDGIGATYTIDRYIEQHQRPFRQNLANRTFNGHIAKLAEGNYGGFFGWPNLTLTPTGGYLGLPANGLSTADMRVVDIYRRDGDKLRENWIFIDILHFLNMQGLDILGRETSMRPSRTL
ncbi:nuclear transport factor 2 family protein [Devosia rhizoryzae]|uniref:Nuclear transport factor 2 family protein n=1 Tax=Devosia rhizoryzae TaxID=2774137 RepID=A0ABX7C3L0_9HYPH|nr:nuclear transport factor 2 family protein [Devosia rhizoryzae]QQR38383.1 nuclear transport factor 2 family protein [Devosia rhizoryzae]